MEASIKYIGRAAKGSAEERRRLAAHAQELSTHGPCDSYLTGREAVSSDPGFVKYICDQVDDAGGISARKMFGEWAIYSGRKVVALVCDDRLFVRPTVAGRAFVGEPTESPPYPGARPHFLIDDRIDDRQWLTELIRVTERELPLPKPKQRRLD
jgi:TfoX/Sxy family transcriptional regulator of competence genes